MDEKKVNDLLEATCTDYVRDGHGAFETIKDNEEITILDLSKFSGLTTAAWAEGLGIAEVTWYSYRNKKKVPEKLMGKAFVLAMESKAIVRGFRSFADARKLYKIKEILEE